MSKVYKNESGYIDLIKDVLKNGVQIPDRTGTGSIAIFDSKLVYDVGKQFPFSTIRPAALRLAFEEFWFFLNGKTQTKELEDLGCNFWVGNTSREFLDNRGLYYLIEGDMGKAYGSQLRQYGKTTSKVCTDQLKQTFNLLKNDKYSRRIYSTMWNPNESHLMALTPCHHSHQFVVLPENGVDTLHLKLINRSLDVVFGLSFAVQQYALYLMCVAKVFGFKVGTLSVDLSQVHIYNNQILFATELIERSFGTNGTIKILKDLNSLDDVLKLKWSDICISDFVVNTSKFKTAKPQMAV